MRTKITMTLEVEHACTDVEFLKEALASTLATQEHEYDCEGHGGPINYRIGAVEWGDGCRVSAGFSALA